MTTTAQPLRWLLLGARPHNALSRAGIRTVGDLVDLSEDDLRDIHGFGVKGVAEVVATLATVGLSLRPNAQQWGLPAGPSNAALPTVAADDGATRRTC